MRLERLEWFLGAMVSVSLLFDCFGRRMRVQMWSGGKFQAGVSASPTIENNVGLYTIVWKFELCHASRIEFDAKENLMPRNTRGTLEDFYWG